MSHWVYMQTHNNKFRIRLTKYIITQSGRIQNHYLHHCFCRVCFFFLLVLTPFPNWEHQYYFSNLLLSNLLYSSFRMGSSGVQIVCMALGILGLIAAVVTIAVPRWKVSAFIGQNIITAQVNHCWNFKSSIQRINVHVCVVHRYKT